MSKRYEFTNSEHAVLRDSILIEFLDHQDPAKRSFSIQPGDNIITDDLSSVIVHDHKTGFIYSAALAPESENMSATNKAAANIILDCVMPPTTTTTTTTINTTGTTSPTTPPTLFNPRHKISGHAASPEPPSTTLQELP